MATLLSLLAAVVTVVVCMLVYDASIAVLLVLIPISVVIFCISLLIGHFLSEPLSDLAKKMAAFRSGAPVTFEPDGRMYEADLLTSDFKRLVQTTTQQQHDLAIKERRQNEFISDVAHELRTPLTAIKGWAETLQTGGIGRETYDKGMNVIVREAERLSGMVEELLDFSRMQSGRMRLILKKIDLLAELDEAVYMFTDRARTEHKNLIYDEEDTMLSPILGDVNRLRQVFINVIDNALKYTNPGGTVRVSAYEDDGFIRVIIKDSGCGIPAEHLPNVKKKFYKANQNVRGNGIGLAVANEIMELHSGSLDIDSEEGMSTTVIITIPTMKKLEMNPELSNTTQIPTATAQVQVVERKQD